MARSLPWVNIDLRGGGMRKIGSQVTTDGLREITAPRLPGLAKNTWQRVEIVAMGSVMRMLVDGQEMSAFEDTQSRLKRGQVAIRLLAGGHIEIRRIEIKEPTEKDVAVSGGHTVSTNNAKDASSLGASGTVHGPSRTLAFKECRPSTQ